MTQSATWQDVARVAGNYQDLLSGYASLWKQLLEVQLTESEERDSLIVEIELYHKMMVNCFEQPTQPT